MAGAIRKKGSMAKVCPAITAQLVGTRLAPRAAVRCLPSKLLATANAPNWAVKPTPTLAMASPFSWPVSVPSTRFAPSGAAYLGR